VRIDSDTKNQLEALAKRARRSKSFLAAEAIAAYVEAETWQLDEIQAGLQELDKGREVAQGDVSKWLRSCATFLSTFFPCEPWHRPVSGRVVRQRCRENLRVAERLGWHLFRRSFVVLDCT
jgi:RHH-type rel operon transcriptional repressor/antitoxin RelB